MRNFVTVPLAHDSSRSMTYTRKRMTSDSKRIKLEILPLASNVQSGGEMEESLNSLQII